MTFAAKVGLLRVWKRTMEARDIRMSTLHHALLWLSAAVSIASLGMVIWKGGMLNERVDADSKRIQLLEQRGSVSLVAHEVMDDARIKAIEERLRKVEEAILALHNMKADIAEIKTSLEFMTGKRTIPKPN